MGSRLLRIAFAVGAMMLSVPGTAWAGDSVAAERLFDEGLAAMKAERWSAACEAFAGSNEADPSAGTQINLGLCHEKQKKYATALIWFNTAARTAEEKNQGDRAKLARSEAARVEPKTHKLVITMRTPVEGVSITRSGERVPSALLGKDVPVDPGKYTIEVSAKGKKPMSKPVEIPDAPGRTALEIPTLEDAPEPTPVLAPAGDPAGADTRPIVTTDGSGQRTTGIVVGGAGVLALLAAGGVQILASNEQSKSEELKADSDKPANAADRDALIKSSSSHHDAAKNDQLIAIVTGAGGVVLLGVGAVLYFTAPRSTKSGNTRIVPAVAPGFAGAAIGGTF